MLKNSSTLAVYVPVNLSLQFGFVSVNGRRKPYFVDAPRTLFLQRTRRDYNQGITY